MRTTAYVKDDSEQISVSDGGGISALPSGECGPSVMLAYSPSGSLPSMTNGGDPGAPASAPTKNPDAGALADRIDWHAFFEAVMDERIILFELTNDVPLFIRDGDHLRRWSA